MKTKVFILLSLMFIVGHSTVKAEITILSPEAWSPTVHSTWNNTSGLSYTNTVWGNSYYNPNWQDMNRSGGIDYKVATCNLYISPSHKRAWEFRIPITNLNAEKGYSYYSNSNPNKKQSFDQIYWGFLICMVVDGVEKTITVWLKRGALEYYPNSNTETYDSGRTIEYAVNGGSWQKSNSYTAYPSCQPSAAPSLKINTWSMSRFVSWNGRNLRDTPQNRYTTYVSWGDLQITNFNGYLQEIKYIRILVGTQAKVLIGEPNVYAASQDIHSLYAAQDLIEQGSFVAAKQKLYKTNGKYYEIEAMNLALCYASLEEYDNCIEMCNALIKYQGEYQSTAYSVRGLVLERKGQKTEALEDYKKANDSEHYNRLYNEIYNSKAAQNTQQTPTQKTTNQQNTKKPPLSK